MPCNCMLIGCLRAPVTSPPHKLHAITCFIKLIYSVLYPAAADVYITSFSSSGNNLVGSSDFTITCVANVTQDNVNSFNVTIQDHSTTNVILTSRVFNVPMAVRQYPVNYTFSQLNPSDTGTYSCVLGATVSNMSQTMTQLHDITGIFIHS